MLSRIKNLGLPSFNSVAFPSLSLQWNREFELDEESLLRPWIQESTFCLQQSCSAQILLEL